MSKLRDNYNAMWNGYSLPGWRLDYGKLERMVSEADAELTATRDKLAEAEKLIACYRQHLGEVVTYGADAETLDKQLQVWVPRARNAEAKLAAVREAWAKLTGFATCDSAPGEYKVTIQYKSLAQAQDAYSALIDITKAVETIAATVEE